MVRYIKGHLTQPWESCGQLTGRNSGRGQSFSYPQHLVFAASSLNGHFSSFKHLNRHISYNNGKIVFVINQLWYGIRKLLQNKTALKADILLKSFQESLNHS